MTRIEVGEQRSMVVVSSLSRAQIAQYAGASGDFHPLHVDNDYASRIRGYKSVFVHGMFTMAVSGRVLTDWVPIEDLMTYSARFRDQVWPGDSLEVVATITGISDEGRRAQVGLTTTAADGRIVMTGAAAVRIG
jgi:acyl dehydratase